MFKYALYVKSKNMKQHLHAHNCSCKLKWAEYELVGVYNSYKDAEDVWSARNEEGTTFHGCAIEQEIKEQLTQVTTN
jgi:hypothetical protein